MLNTSLGVDVLDLATVLVMIGAGMTLIGLLGTYLATQQDSDGALGYWSAGCLMNALAVSLIAFRAFLPSFLTIVIANCATAAGTFLLYHGLARFDSLPRRTLFGAGLIVSVGLLISYWTYVEPDIYARIIVNTASQMVVFLLLAWAMLRPGVREHSVVRRLLGALFLMLVGVGIARIVYALSSTGPRDVMMLPDTLIMDIWLLSLFAVGMLASIEFLLMPGQRKQNQLIQLLRFDAMTGALNRQAFQTDLDARRNQSDNRAGSLLMLDLDHFKHVNDQYGHRAGDLVLQMFASTVAALLRRQDLLSRYGGEEFTVFLPETSVKDALPVAERIRRAVENMETLFDGNRLKITVSIGIAPVNLSEGYEEALGAADQAMYFAKSRGRNRVETSDFGQ
jgi:diguanylate cyclase (GGDEF)-like protein